MAPLALLVIMVLAGISILTKKETAFSKSRVLVKPNSSYIGSALIICGLLNLFIPFNGLVVLLFVIIIVVAYFLSQQVPQVK